MSATPSLSAAIRRLEGRLGVELLARRGRRVTVTPAGELLHRRGRELLAHADAGAAEVRHRDAAASGRVRLGLSPTARHGVGPRLLAACAERGPAVMIYTGEDTTGALMRDVAAGRLALAVAFCAPSRPGDDLELIALADEPAIVHLPSTHALATRPSLGLADLRDETVLVAASRDSMGFTNRVLSAFSRAGIAPPDRPIPRPGPAGGSGGPWGRLRPRSVPRARPRLGIRCAGAAHHPPVPDRLPPRHSQRAGAQDPRDRGVPVLRLGR